MKLENVIAIRTNKKVYRDEDKAIKVFDSNFSKANILNEALNQARVEETGLKIPKILEVTKIDGKWAIVSEFIAGKTLDVLMNETPQKYDEYLDLFINIQMQVHAQKAPLLNKLKDKLNRKISESQLDPITRYDLHMRLEGMPKSSKVCHGDFDPSNIIIGEDSIPYIIDWSHATQGNASADAAMSYLNFKLKGQNEQAERYLDLFCFKSDTEKQYIQRWMPIAAAAQSVKGNEKDRDLLLSWVNIIDFQ